MATNTRIRSLTITTLAVLILPVAADLLLHGPLRSYGYLAIDFFYYETIAQNYIKLGFASFDQETQTNGFHPLWQALLVGLLHTGGATHSSGAVLFTTVLALGTVLIAAGIVFLLISTRSAQQEPNPLFPWIVPGVFALLTYFAYRPENDFGRFRIPGAERPIVGTMWHHINGMETPLVILAFGASTFFLVQSLNMQGCNRARQGWTFGAGIALGFLALARLDHTIFSITMACSLLFVEDKRCRKRLPLLAATGLGIPLIAYLSTTYLSTGSFVPVSGSVKSSFPRITTDNINDLLVILRGRREIWVPDAWRLAQQLIPAAVATIYLFFAIRPANLLRGRIVLRPRRSAFDIVLLTTAPAVLILAGYNFFFVRSDFQGHWYFPASTTLCTLYILQIADSTATFKKIHQSSRAFGALNAVSFLLALAFFKPAHYRPLLNDDIKDFYEVEARSIRQHYAEHPKQPKFIEFYDALFASSTGYPTMNGYGLVVDPEAARARKVSLDEIFSLAVHRGFDRVVSFNLTGEKLGQQPSRAELEETLRRYISPERLSGYDLSLDYLSNDRRHVIIRATVRQPEGLD